MKLESMSRNVVSIMKTLAGNQMLAKLLVYENPYKGNDLTNAQLQDLVNVKSATSKISPFPFDPEAVKDDGIFIRVYYNSGDFNSNETIAESKIHIDIICANSLWLINNGRESLVRPYDIMGRVIDLVGKRSVGTHQKVTFDSYSHLYINTKFQCIRLYTDYMSVES